MTIFELFLIKLVFLIFPVRITAEFEEHFEMELVVFFFKFKDIERIERIDLENIKNIQSKTQLEEI